MSDTQIFMVSEIGERHEDHKPRAFVTLSQLKEFFPFAPTMMFHDSGKEIPSTDKNFMDLKGQWVKIDCLLVDEYEFTEEEISHFMQTGLLLNNGDDEHTAISTFFIYPVGLSLIPST